MYELLLQADKALAEGALEQAERTYWQLIDLDPTNAIAAAGLALVSLVRGDQRLARTFADRALGIDPESIAARRVIEALEQGATVAAGTEPPELPMLAAERLEALSRRRTLESAPAHEPGAPERAGSKGGAGKSRAAAALPTDVARRDAADGGHAAAAAAVARARPRPGKEPRGRTRPDQIVPLPSEPLHERRPAGRLAAAAAAAAAAVSRETVQPDHEPHHGMPVGRRHFEAVDLNGPPSDAFSAAEMAAAVEAVDSLHEAAPDAADAADAADADESVAPPIPLMSDETEFSDDAFEAAEAVARSQASMELRRRPSQPAVAEIHETEAGELTTHESGREPGESVSGGQVDSIGPLTVGPAESPPASSLEFADAAAAEAAGVAEIAATERSNEPSPGAERSTEVNAGAGAPRRKHGLFHRFRRS